MSYVDEVLELVVAKLSLIHIQMCIRDSTKTVDGVKVLDNVSFIVNHDDKIAFVGADELAKTTLFKICLLYTS